MDVIEKIFSEDVDQTKYRFSELSLRKSQQKIKDDNSISINVFPLFGFDQLCEINNFNRLQYLEIKIFNLNEDTKGLRVIRELRF